MCLLNGEVAGALPHTTDFGVQEEYNLEAGTTTYTNIPIKTIIRESVQNYGNELAQNIIINDLEDCGLDLVEYRGDKTLYLLKEVNTDIFVNMTLNENQTCYVQEGNSWVPTTISNNRIIYDGRLDGAMFESVQDASHVKLVNTEEATVYTVSKMEYGAVVGYRLTELIYAGDLILNVGEPLTSMLDKLVAMLGDFEYFYDVDGRFIFQHKKDFMDSPWNNLVEQQEDTRKDGLYVEAAMNGASAVYHFEGSNLISSFQNTPNFSNLKNDFAIWGKRKSITGAELDIHMRYAIDHKPTQYYSLKDQKLYTSDKVDWRELIYKMALDYRHYYHDDDFLYNLAQANPQYPTGKTGYEQYYTDMEGFWRILYDPTPEADPEKFNNDGWSKTIEEAPETLLFWFDFLESEGNEMEPYSVPIAGSRPKAVNDTNVKAIYYRTTPNVIFSSATDATFEHQTGYVYIQLQPYMENLFIMSSQGKSAKNAIDEMLYHYSYCVETVSINAVPVYYLEPNTRISVYDEESKIDGEYVINKITIPLNYNGMMSISATKAVSTII